MPVIACDVSKATLDAAWLNESKQCWFDRSKIANNRRGWQEMLRWLEKSSGQGRREFTLVVEATGVYHRPLIDFAVAEGLRVIVTNPGRAAENARSHNRLNKNDRLDARGLYGYGKELKKVHEYVPDSQEISVLKALLSRLRQLDKDLLRERNRLEKCPFIAGSQGLAASNRRQIKALLREKNLIQRQIDELIRTDPRLTHLQKLLCSIKGIGKVASQWLLPLLYRQQFDSARQLAAFGGGLEHVLDGVLGDDGDVGPPDEEVAPLVAGGDADVGVAGLARPVDNAAHDRHLQRDLTVAEGLLCLAGDLDHVDLGPATTGAGDQVDVLALAQAQALEQGTPRASLFHRVGGEAVADGVADALGQQRGHAGGGLEQPGGRRPGLGDAEVQRVVHRVGQQAVGLDHERHVRRLDRDLHVVEADLGRDRGHRRW